MSIKINQLEIENVKRIKAVKIEPKETGLTIIGGNNNQGKTSVLDAIAWALGGEKYKPSQAVREGSMVPPNLHLVMSNGLVVERKGKNSTLTLGSADNIYDKIMGEEGVIAKIEDSGYFVNGHMADISMRAKLRGLRDDNGQPIFKSDMQSGTNYTLDGSAMDFPNNGAFDKSKALMISGDFSQLVYSIRQDITFKLFTEGVIQNSDGSIAYNLMQQDMIALRAVMRLGWEIPNPINSLKEKASERCPFAILKAGA